MNAKKRSDQHLSDEDRDVLFLTLEKRFNGNIQRHEGLEWSDVRSRLERDAGKVVTLNEMERTGGEPDVIGFDKGSRQYFFVDCSPESPKGRRSLCYDRSAWESRKEHKPESDAVSVAEAMGVELLTEEQYRHLQTLGEFDLKTSSWVQTPPAIRERGGAMFCDRRYGTVWTYHNGAESYYGARGFRAILRV